MKRMPRIKDVMTAFPFSIDAGSTMDQARDMMKEHRVGHLPVKSADGALSVISLRELERVKLPGHTHTDFDELTVGDLCPLDSYVVDLYTSLIEVLDYMASEHVDCALITRQEKLAGIFTFSDACRAYSEHLKEEFSPIHPMAVATLHKVNLGSLTAQASHWPLDHTRPTLVFLHGAGFHGGFWFPQEPLKKDFNLIFLNLPGRQTSAAVEGNLQRYTDSAEAAIAQLKAKVIVVGHSMGGAVCQLLMARQPAWLQAGVLACTGAKLKVAPVVNQLLTQGASVFMQMFTQSGPGLSLDQVTLLGQQMAKTETGLTDFLACNRFDFMEGIASITQPCLVVVGDQDLLTPEKYSQYLHEQITTSELELVKGTGHLLPWESPITFNRLISEFARRHESHPVSTAD